MIEFAIYSMGFVTGAALGYGLTASILGEKLQRARDELEDQRTLVRRLSACLRTPT